MPFENFKKLCFGEIDPNNPDEYANKINKLQRYVDKIRHDFYEEYGYCTGCRRIVKKDEVYSEQVDSRILIRCNKCHTLWYIRNK